MSLATVLAADPERCAQGFHLSQHPSLCGCTEGSEWATFVAALKAARAADGSISQTNVRPLIKGRIAPRHVGQLYRRAVREHLIRRAGEERSTDVTGGNAHHEQAIYRWTGP